MKFYELAVGARFILRGRRFEKIAMSMARDEQGLGSLLMGETEIVPVSYTHLDVYKRQSQSL